MMKRRMIIFCVVIVAVFSLKFSVFAADQPVKIHPPLHTDGMKIIDASGQEVLLRGVNISGMEWGAGTRGVHGCHEPFGCYWVPKQSELDNIANWGFNIARIPISWADLEPTPGQCCNNAYIEALDNVVKQLGDKGVMVFFSMHQWVWSPQFEHQKRNGQTVHGNGEPPWLYPDNWFSNNPITGGSVGHDRTGQRSASQEFFMNRPKEVLGGEKIQDHLIGIWRYVARHYKSFPNVIGADLFNEPYNNQKFPDSLETFYLHAGQAVSEEAPDWLLIFESSISHPKLEHPEIFLNSTAFQHKAVYSMHIYTKNADRFVQKANRFFGSAQQWNVPYLIGEFHCFINRDSANRNQFTVDQNQTQQIMDYMKQNGIHWTYWAYSLDAQPIAVHDSINMDLVRALQAGF